MDEVPAHYHGGGGQKVLLDHNDNEMTQGGGGGHYHHRMGGMVNGGKDPNWRPARRRRKDDVDERGVSAGVRLYMNTSAHMAVAPLPAGPYNPAHHHQQQPLQQTTHHSNNHHPHPKMPPPASPNQIPNHSSSHPNASTVSRGGGGGTGGNSSHHVTAPAAATIPVLTVPVNANNPTVILAGHEQPLLVPVVAVASTGAPPPPLPVEVPVRSRRDVHHGSAGHGGGQAAVGGNATGAASSAVTQRATAVQFDLAASAFPPLPGSSSVSTVVSGGGAGDVQQVPVTTVLPSTNVKNLSSVASDSSVVVDGKEVEVVAGKQSGSGGPGDNNKSSNTEGSGQVAAVAAVPVVASAWGDSLADVVKGTAKAAKSSSNANGE